MKRILFFILALTCLASCQEEYELDTNFTQPDALDAPSWIKLIAGSNRKVVFNWEGGGAEDGMYVLYEVLFDKRGGDFSNPLYKQSSDLGGLRQASVTQAQLNLIAKAAGAKPLETAEIIWTVRTSKGGTSKIFKPAKEIGITRFDGISDIPEQLYLYGTAVGESSEKGRMFGKREDGVFVIYTKFENGDLYFANGTDAGATRYYATPSNGFKEGDGVTEVKATGAYGARVVVDFNTSTMTVDNVSGMKMVWLTTDQEMGATPDNGFKPNNTFRYDGNGRYVMPRLVINTTHRNPWWGDPNEYKTDDMYFFLVQVGASEYQFRNPEDGVSTIPGITTPQEYYLVDDLVLWTWERKFYWRVAPAYHNQTCDVAIYTGEDGRLYHSIAVSK